MAWPLDGSVSTIYGNFQTGGGAAGGSSFQNPFSGPGRSGNPGTWGNPSNYNTGPTANGFGGAGEIAGGGAVPLGSLNLPYFNQQYGQIQGLLNGAPSPWATGATTSAASVGSNPYASQWGGVISQLQQQANGMGPSIAQQAYQQASQDSMGQLGSMAQGSSSPAQAREAMLQQGRVGQGMAQGLAQARTGEELGAQQALQGALSGAGNQAFQFANANAGYQQGANNLNAQLAMQQQGMNQGMYGTLLGQQLGLSEAQLKALGMDQGYNLGIQGLTQQAQANQWGALSGLLGAGAGIAMGNPGAVAGGLKQIGGAGPGSTGGYGPYTGP